MSEEQGEGAEYYFRRAVEHHTKGELGKAEECYKRALGINPEYAEAHNNYAGLLAEQKRYREAEEHYRRALQVNPEDAGAHNNYAILLADRKRYGEAEEHYRKALEIDPEYAAAHNNYAILLEDRKRYREADEHYKKALEANPEYAGAHNNYANLLAKQKRYGEAEEHYRRALEINPEGGEADWGLGDLLASRAQVEWEGYLYEGGLQEVEKAIGLFRKGRRGVPSDLWLLRGYVCAKLGEMGRAARSFQRALKADESNYKARWNLRQLMRAQGESGLRRWQTYVVFFVGLGLVTVFLLVEVLRVRGCEVGGLSNEILLGGLGGGFLLACVGMLAHRMVRIKTPWGELELTKNPPPTIEEVTSELRR